MRFHLRVSAARTQVPVYRRLLSMILFSNRVDLNDIVICSIDLTV